MIMMNIGILFAALAGLLYGILSLVYKYAEQKKCRSAQFTFVLSFSGAGVAFLKSFTEQSQWNEPLLWISGSAMGLVILFGIFVILAANRLGPVYSSWTVVNVSFLFAIFLSALFLKEKLLCVDPFNLLLFCFTLFFFVKGMKAGQASNRHRDETLRHLLALISVFVANGLATFGTKLKYAFFDEMNTSAYATIFYLVSAVITFVMMLYSKNQKFLTKEELISGILGGICISVATILFLSAMSLPAAAVFTITQGVSLTSGVALTTLIAKERLNRWMIFGLLMGLIVLLAVIFREFTARWICNSL